MAALFFPLVVQPPGAACHGSCLYFCPLPAEQLPGRAVLALPAHTAAFWVRALLPRARQRGYFWPWCPAWPLCCFLTCWELQIWQPLSHFPTPAPLSPARLNLEAFGGAACPLAAPGGPSGPGGGHAHPAALPRSGWIAALSELHGNLAVAIIMMVVAAFFTLCAVLSLFLLKQVSSSRGWGQLRPLVGHPWVGLLGRGGLPG